MFSLHLSRKKAFVLAVVLVGPWLITLALLLRSAVPRISHAPLDAHSDEGMTGQIAEARPGPWGRLMCVNVQIDIPDEFVSIPPPDQPPSVWLFKGYTRDHFAQLLRSTDLPASYIETFLAKAVFAGEADNLQVTPGDELILNLTPAARAAIYAVLIETPDSGQSLDPVWFRPDQLAGQLEESGLQPASINLLKRLLYSNSPSPLLLFVDRNEALRQLPDDRERRLFVKAISRKSTVLLRLMLDSHSDVAALAAYWGIGGRHKDIIPLMRAVQNIPGGWNLSIIYLLPSFMRDRVCRYPFPSADPNAVKQDCFWSAFNTFNLLPDDRFANMDYVRQTLDREYYSIAQPSQFGDIVFLATPDNSVVHAAVYIADDIVFTKNGYHCTQPWIFMRLM